MLARKGLNECMCERMNKICFIKHFQCSDKIEKCYIRTCYHFTQTGKSKLSPQIILMSVISRYYKGLVTVWLAHVINRPVSELLLSTD